MGFRIPIFVRLPELGLLKTHVWLRLRSKFSVTELHKILHSLQKNRCIVRKMPEYAKENADVPTPFRKRFLHADMRMPSALPCHAPDRDPGGPSHQNILRISGNMLQSQLDIHHNKRPCHQFQIGESPSDSSSSFQLPPSKSRYQLRHPRRHPLPRLRHERGGPSIIRRALMVSINEE